MDPIEQALLAEIRERPFDDVPRLVYADHLIGKGDPRGDLIVASLRGKDDEVHSLWLEHRLAWRAELPRWAQLVEPDLHRGFVAAITLTGPLSDLVQNNRWREVVALTPIPVVKLRGEAIMNVHLRDDGAVGATVEWARDARRHVVTVIELPSLRSLARAQHRVSLEESFLLLASAHSNRLRFTPDKIAYEVIEGARGTDRTLHELSYRS